MVSKYFHLQKSHTNSDFSLKFLIILSTLIFLVSFLPITPTHAVQPEDDQVFVYFGSETGCVVCIAKHNDLNEFLKNHTDIYYQTVWVSYQDEANVTAFREFKEEYGITSVPTPFVLMGKGNYTVVLRSNDIDMMTLEQTYEEVKNYDPANDPSDLEDKITPFISYGTGFLTGLSPCVILVTTFISSVLVIQDNLNHEKSGEKSEEKSVSSDNEISNPPSSIDSHVSVPNSDGIGQEVITVPPKLAKKSKSLGPIYFGFILGVVLMYITISFASLWVFSQFSNIIFGRELQITFVVILVLLGLWFIMDAFNAHSKLFATPKKLKKLVGKWARKGKFIYSFILGFIFSIIKIPCVASGLFALVLGIADNPSLYIPSVVLFILGSMTPLVVLMILIGFGIQTEKVEAFRLKYRPYIRIASGLMIIGLSIWALLST